MNKREEVLAALQSGPVKFRELLHGRSAAFRLAYSQLLQEGLIEVRGTGTKRDPKWVGRKGAKFPEKGYFVRSADVDLLVRSGMSRPDAEVALRGAVETGGEAGVVELCGQAYDRILSTGKKPITHVPPPKDKLKPRVTFPSLEEPKLLNEKDF